MPCEEETRDMDVERARDVDGSVVFEFICRARVESGIKLRRLGHDAVDGVCVRDPLISRHIVPVLSDLRICICATVSPVEVGDCSRSGSDSGQGSGEGKCDKRKSRSNHDGHDGVEKSVSSHLENECVSTVQTEKGSSSGGDGPFVPVHKAAVGYHCQPLPGKQTNVAGSDTT